MPIDDSEIRLARKIQQKLLPNVPELEGFDIGAAMHPLHSTGGDFFDFIPMLDGSIGIVVGDACGHGEGPALLMATTRAYLRAFARTHLAIGELLNLTNNMLCEDSDRRFVTLFFARLELQTPSMTYVNAGHGMCWIIDSSGTVNRLNDPNASGFPLGIVPDYDYTGYVSQTIPLQSGDIVYMGTDGLIECPNSTMDLFGMDPIIDIIHANRNRRAPEIIDTLFAAAHLFMMGQLDDPHHAIPDQISNMDEMLRVIEKYPDIEMYPDDMTAVIVKVK